MSKQKSEANSAAAKEVRKQQTVQPKKIQTAEGWKRTQMKLRKSA